MICRSGLLVANRLLVFASVLTLGTHALSQSCSESLLQPGDANSDLSFDSTDLVLVMQAGKYETGELAEWDEGDWNADGQFDSSDLILAWSVGHFEMGPYAHVVPGPAPTPRGGAPAVWLRGPAGQSQMYLFGGMDPITRDAHSFSPQSGWLEITNESAPSRRCHHSFVPIGDGSAILFGGFSREGRFNDTYRFDPMTALWSKLTTTGSIPEPRCLHASVWIPSTNELVVYGGITASGFFTENYFLDTSFLNLKSLEWRRINDSAPGARSGPVMFYSSRDDAVYLWSGLHKRGTFANQFEDFFDGYTSELWKLDPHSQSWTIEPTSGEVPVGREDPVFFWDDELGQLFVMHGRNKDAPDDLMHDSYYLDLTTKRWHQIDIRGPEPEARWRPSVAYDPSRKEAWVFGGWKDFGHNMFGDAWRFDVATKRWAPVCSVGNGP